MPDLEKIDDQEEDVISTVFGESEEENDEVLEAEDDEVEDPEEDEKPERRTTTQQAPVIVNVGTTSTEKKPKKKKEETSDDMDDYEEWMEALDPAGMSGYFIELYRVTPRYDENGEQIYGFIDKYSEKITISDLKEKHGGGTYDVVMVGPKKGKKTGRRIISKKRVAVTGQPIVHGSKKKSSGGEENLSIIEATLKHQKDLMDNVQKDKREEKDKSERMFEMLMKRDDGGKTEKLIQSVLDSQNKNLELQLEAAREETKRARDELKEERQKSREESEKTRREMRDLRDDFEKKAESSFSPILEFMKATLKETKEKSSGDVAIMMELFKTQINSVQENNKNQIDILNRSHETQTKLLQSELQRLSEELKETRIKNSGDLVSQLKNYKMIKDLFDSNSGEDKSLGSMLMDNLPEILNNAPKLAMGIKGLFSAGTPVRRPVQRIMAGPGSVAIRSAPPPPPPVQTTQAPAQPQTQQPQQSQPASSDTMTPEAAKVLVMMADIKEKAEDAMEAGTEATEFTKEQVIGKYEEETLQLLASVQTADLLNQLQEALEAEDSSLATVKGRDFLRKMHITLKQHYGM